MLSQFFALFAAMACGVSCVIGACIALDKLLVVYGRKNPEPEWRTAGQVASAAAFALTTALLQIAAICFSH